MRRFEAAKWWQNWTILEKSLLIALLVAFFVLTTSIISKQIYAEKSGYQDRKSCSTPDCLRAASTILDSMDQSVKPCDNFYQFVCGKYLKEQFVTAEIGKVDRFSTHITKVDEQLKKIVGSKITSNDTKSFKLVKNYYHSCMDSVELKARGLNPIKDIIKEIGGWPLILGDNWNDKNFSWMKLMGKFHAFGFPSDLFIGVDFVNSLENSSIPSIFLRPPFNARYAGYHHTPNSNSSLFTHYYNQSMDVVLKFGANETTAKKELRNMVEFELHLSRIAMEGVEVMNGSSATFQTYKPVIIKNLIATYPFIKWIDYINQFLSPYAKVDDNDMVYLTVPTFYPNFEELLNRTSKRVLANYAIWKLVDYSLPYVSTDIREYELNEIGERWEICLSDVSFNLIVATSAMYVRNHVDETINKTATELISYIQKGFRKILSEVDWMNESMRKNSIAKADAMKYHVAYSNELLIDSKLDEYYKDLKIDPKEYLRNVLNIAIFHRNEMMRQLMKPYQNNEWSGNVLSILVNGLSNTGDNSIDIPAAITQGSFFNPNRPQYMNYGAIGFIIGYGITYEFESFGSQIDHEGNPSDWWDDKSKEIFVKKAQCVKDQYENYTIEEFNLKIDGTNTKEVNVADIGAAKIIYNAYKQWVQQHGEEPRLSGLDYTNEQMLWISMASSWCEKSEMDFQRMMIQSGSYIPGMYRVIGTVSNSYEFAKSFNCPVGAKMNPAKKCIVWWKKRTILEKCLLISFFMAILLFSSIMIVTKHVRIKFSNGSNQTICVTLDCIQAASTILEGMDQSVNPCDNFYHFACGKFLREQFIPEGKRKIGRVNDLNSEVSKQLKRVIASNITSNDTKSFKLVKHYYQSCMDEKKIQEDGLKPLKDILKEFDGWPVVLGDEWNEKNFSWMKLMGKFLTLGYPTDVFIGIGLGVSIKNSSKLMIYLYPPITGLYAANLTKNFNSSDVMTYYNYSVDVAVKFGANKTIATRDLRDMVEFDMNLTKIVNSALNKSIAMSREDKLEIKPIPLKDIIAKYPSIKWIDYINQFLSPYGTVDTTDAVYLIEPTFFADLEKLLNRTSNRILANYAICQLVRLSVPYVSKDIADKRENEPMTSRWKMCLSEVASDLIVATSAMYVQNRVDKSLKRKAKEMVSYMQQEFRKILYMASWMHEFTWKNALAKADAMAYHVAYPNELLINAKLDEYYKNLQVDPKQYLRSMLNVSIFQRDLMIRQFRKPVVKNVWSEHALSIIVNAFASHAENSIDIPAAIMQGSFFNPHRPQYMNYGAIGFVIGHEITHGFDNIGRQFDKNGNLRDWWDDKSKDNFKIRAQCIIDQYGNYTVEELNMKINGTATQGENIADIGAAKIMYNGYKQWVQQHGEEPRLPGLDYTNEQMVWISMASSWCEKTERNLQKTLIKYDPHSPGIYRVIGTVSNSYEFAKNFNCPVGAKMNPRKKCTVW